MAYTDPKTWSPGDVLTAAELNTYVRDNTTDRPRARVYYAAGTQSIPNNTNTIVDWDTTSIDTAGMVDLTNNKIVIATDGDYLIGGRVMFAGHADSGVRALYLVKNGGIVARVQAQPDAAGSPQGLGMHVSDLYSAVAGDEFWVVVFHTVGSAITIGGGAEQYGSFYAVFEGS